MATDPIIKTQTSQVVLITGASHGLGKEIALQLCREECDLILVARSLKELEITRQEIQGISDRFPLIVSCDVTRQSEVDRLANLIGHYFGRLDVLINNAGIGIHRGLKDLGQVDIEQMFAVNCLGPLICTRAFLPWLEKSRTPYILNVGSLAEFLPKAQNGVYAGTKAALSAITFGLRSELKTSGVQVGLFQPGLMKTNFGKERNTTMKVPPFFWLSPTDAAKKAARMIHRRKTLVRSPLWLWATMSIKRAFSP